MSVRLEVVPSGLLSLDFEVHENGVPVGRIVLRRKMLALRETFLLTTASGEAGYIVRESLLSRRMTVELKQEAAGTPREILLLLVWIALLIHRNESAGSAA